MVSDAGGLLLREAEKRTGIRAVCSLLQGPSGPGADRTHGWGVGGAAGAYVSAAGKVPRKRSSAKGINFSYFIFLLGQLHVHDFGDVQERDFRHRVSVF